jgi:SAM-dependent methyltransferase
MSQKLHGDIDRRLATASGVVLDVGPGTGEMLSRMDASKMTKAYGVEPAVDMHAALRLNAAKNGFGADKYEIIAAGAEPESLIPALHGAGLAVAGAGAGEGVFDTVLCVRVLCGVPRPQETVDELYRLLKPGGRMIVYEHVASPFPQVEGSTRLGYVMQRFWAWAGWNRMMGGCEIDRDTVGVLKRAGGSDSKSKGWETVDLGYWDSWNAVPFIVGELVKA